MTQILRWTVDHLENDAAIVKTPDGQTISFPLSSIYGLPKPGQQIRLIALASDLQDPGLQPMAQALLDELLGK